MSDRSITQQVLGKTIEKLTYADIVKYFSKARSESDRIEFKSYVVGKNDKGPKAHLEEVYESLSALLNSEGGLLVWGAPQGEYPAGSKEKIFLGELTSVQCDRDDDQLNSGILDNLNPMPPNIKHRKLTKGKSLVYVFEVPKSPYAPHQLKGTYYARFGAQKRVAPHYLVEALLRRVTYPNIAPYLRILSISKNERGVFELHFLVFCVNHSRLQNETDISLTVRCMQGKFAFTTFNDKRWLISAGGRQLHFKDVKSVLHYGGHHAEQLSIQIDPDVEEGDTIELLLFIGGRTSPLKSSAYSIQVSSCSRDCGKHIVAKTENSLASSNESDDDAHDQVLRQLLGH